MAVANAVSQATSGRQYGTAVTLCLLTFTTLIDVIVMRKRKKKAVLSRGNRAMPQLFFSV